jgi:hypothetical protein
MTRDPDQLKKDVEFIKQLGFRFENQAKLAEAAARRRNESVNKACDKKPFRQNYGRQKARS